ncbi:hypothetical protein B0H17DRAFT_1126778 [Mycena rosella]|uniref:Uncharacterized protein n=1 Tax=Mycena rosella TaxID=1033263 RepID=A0AAD7GSN3_MYCRO|nr:hypothetical protein B0H17DRAFT_1126778 [Mycena rosella]
MTLWLECKEKIFCHEKYIQWRLDGCPPPPVMEPLPPGIIYEQRLKMTENPTHRSVRINQLVSDYGATFFLEAQSSTIALAFNSVPVFHKIKYTTEDPYTDGGPSDSVVDAIHVQPGKMPKNGNEVAGRFDTALVNDGSGKMTGVDGYCVVQIRAIFSFKPRQIQALFSPGLSPPKHLAYVEWFSAFSAEPEPNHLMYKINRSLKHGDRIASIVPLGNICRSVHLLPKFGPVAPPEWTNARPSSLIPYLTVIFMLLCSD